MKKILLLMGCGIAGFMPYSLSAQLPSFEIHDYNSDEKVEVLLTSSSTTVGQNSNELSLVSFANNLVQLNMQSTDADNYFGLGSQGQSQFKINQAGRISINGGPFDNTPLLYVNGNIGIETSLTPNTSNPQEFKGQFGFYNSGYFGTISYLESSFGERNIEIASPSSIFLESDNEVVIEISESGNVAFNNTDDTYKMNVGDVLIESDVSKRPAILFSEGGSTINDGMSIEYDGTPNITANSRLYINDSKGNVIFSLYESGTKAGIGITNPSANLHVNGVMRIKGAITTGNFSDHSTCTEGKIEVVHCRFGGCILPSKLEVCAKNFLGFLDWHPLAID